MARPDGRASNAEHGGMDNREIKNKRGKRQNPNGKSFHGLVLRLCGGAPLDQT